MEPKRLTELESNIVLRYQEDAQAATQTLLMVTARLAGWPQARPLQFMTVTRDTETNQLVVFDSGTHKLEEGEIVPITPTAELDSD